MFDIITFKVKLQLWENLLKVHNFVHFLQPKIPKVFLPWAYSRICQVDFSAMRGVYLTNMKLAFMLFALP